MVHPERSENAMIRAAILVLFVAPIFGIGSSPQRATAGPAEKTPPSDGAASDAVAVALEKELAGDNSARMSALRERLAHSPDDAAAHWHLGEIRVGDEWVPYDRVADQGERWRELYRYQEERAQRGATVADQLFLANGARAHKLWGEERAHLTQVVALDPFHEEAHNRLGDVLIQSRWVTRESALRSMNAQLRWNQGLEKHGRDAARHVQGLRKLSDRAFSGTADPFTEWSDPERLFALEQAVGDAGDPVHQAYLKWLATFDCYEATIAIVRQALFSERPEIRLEAMHSLKTRSPEDYLQQLVASVRLYRVAETTHPAASLQPHTAAFQWEDIDTVWTAHLALRQPVNVVTFAAGRAGMWSGRRTGQTTIVFPQDREIESKLALAVELCRLDAELLAATAEVRNSRVFRTLSVAFEQPVADAQGAWDLWHEVADTEPTRQRLSRTYEEGWYRDRRQRIRRGPMVPVVYTRAVVGGGSCLVAGTPIMTESGPKAVEAIEPGDRILSQEIETGELSFQPVLGRTQREKATLQRLKTADNEIVCSQGHPFWVNGIGWVQARALRPGMPLHTVLGATEVASTEGAGEGTVHNLVVADSHTYFIGKANALLSHDVTHRQPTNVLVPGLQPIWLSPASEKGRPVTSR